MKVLFERLNKTTAGQPMNRFIKGRVQLKKNFPWNKI